MRKRYFGRKFKKDTHQRKALFRSLIRAMILNDRIETTEAKAKAIKGELEKLVTKAAKNGEASRNHLTSRLVQEPLVNKLLTEIAPKYVSRPGGYTRIVRIGSRLKDNSEMVLLEWVESSEIKVQSANIKEEKKTEKKAKKEEKKSDVKVEKNAQKAAKIEAPKPKASGMRLPTMRRTGSRGK